MKRIGLLSDTHGHLDPKIFQYFDECDELWHAGDIGTMEVVEKLEAFKPLRAVYGNIDGNKARSEFPEHDRFMCEDVDVWMTHIGGYPNKYDKRVREDIIKNPPKLFICGHSHILKVMNDKKLGLLHMNPGAVGKYGFQKVRTMLRFTINGKDIKELEVIGFSR